SSVWAAGLAYNPTVSTGVNSGLNCPRRLSLSQWQKRHLLKKHRRLNWSLNWFSVRWRRPTLRVKTAFQQRRNQLAQRVGFGRFNEISLHSNVLRPSLVPVFT